MNSTLTLIERYVLEAIQKKEIDIITLNLETGVDIRILQNVLKRLYEKKLIICNKNFYRIHLEQLKKYSSEKKIEVLNIMKEIALNNNSLSLKKVYLTKQEQKRVQTMFEDIERYIESKKVTKKAVNKKTVFYWGKQNYGDLIKNYIN